MPGFDEPEFGEAAALVLLDGMIDEAAVGVMVGELIEELANVLVEEPLWLNLVFLKDSSFAGDTAGKGVDSAEGICETSGEVVVVEAASFTVPF